MFWKKLNGTILLILAGLLCLPFVGVAIADADTSLPASAESAIAPVDLSGAKSAILVEASTLKSIIAEKADDKLHLRGHRFIRQRRL